ncbi:hypothetical protein CKO38_08195 [Rhodospirillum rubrum]|uniref:chaperone modulator CbpM n=1 Tax=Rhodospirillum rubrum TaxID=1085 RepID=UPI0019030F85|nr:chaperone modulator CbpM [Rhodospirillum rubrum]MBK1664543.1 hypothetical protein [Rhodospirillum rubrum]MBK1676651.1 hypothetical protein [Rhodospirillum rubrum]
MRLSERDVVASVGQLSLTHLRLWVSEGWVAPAQGEAGPAFDEIDLARIRLIWQLRSEMDLNEEAIPVVLSLIDQIHGLRQELRTLAGAVDDLPADSRAHLRRALGKRRQGEG